MCQDVNLSNDDLDCRMETEMEQKGLFLFLLISPSMSCLLREPEMVFVFCSF